MKTNQFSIAILLAVVISLFGTKPAAGQAYDPGSLPSVELPAGLDRVLRDYETAWAAGDADALAGLFSEDGFVLSGSDPPMRGRDAIRARYANAGGPLLLRAIAFEIDGSVGYIIGAYTYTEGVDEGKFVLTLRSVNGRWLITSDQDNSISR